MSNYQELWWKEEVNNAYKLLTYFSTAFAIVSTSIRLFSWFFLKTDLVHEHLIFIFVHCFAISLIKYYERNYSTTKEIVLVVVSEIYSTAAFLAKEHLMDQPSMYLAFSIIFTTVIEMPIIKNKLLFNLLLAKNSYCWLFDKMLFLNDNDFAVNAIQFNLFISIVVMCNYTNRYNHKISYERFIFSKEVEISKDRLKLITQSHSDGILIISNENHVNFFNSNILNIMQCTPDEILYDLRKYEYSQGKKVSSFHNSNSLFDDIKQAFLDLEDLEMTLGVTLVHNINIEWKIQKILWENNSALFVTARNINKIVELEKSIADSQMKTILLRSVSHELRTPLNSISFFANDLLDKTESILKEDELQKLRIILVSSKLMLSLIDDLLDYSKIIAGVFTIKKSYCNIRKIVTHVCQLIDLQAKAKNLNMGYRIDPSLPLQIFTDPIRLSQVILNLLSNALKFTFSGSIELCFTLDTKHRLKCSVEDTGIGISDEIQRKLFTEFASTYIPGINPQGSGLGLWISNYIVKSLGSKRIKVKSSVGKGSIFYFSMEIFQEKEETNFSSTILQIGIEELKPLDMARYNSIKSMNVPDILIVDDDEFNRIALSSILTQFKITYEEAYNGKDAINKILEGDKRKRRYRAVIMDCNMPIVDGYEASKTLKALYEEGKLQYMPFIIGYSAYSSEEDKNCCLKCGMVDYLTKPCPPDIIIATVKKFL